MKCEPHLLVFDGFGDWEAAFATAELGRSGHHQVVTVGDSGDPVIARASFAELGVFSAAVTAEWYR
jgi:hypothetical protein